MSLPSPEAVQPGLEVVSNKSAGLEVVNKPPVYGNYSPMPQSPHQKGAYTASASPTGNGDYKDEKPERTILGMRGATFCLFLALIFVIVAAGVGGGVGGTLAVNNARKNAVASALPVTITQTISPTSCPAPSPTSVDLATATDAFVAPTPIRVALDCKTLSGTTQFVTVDSKQYLFALTCGQDFGPVDGKTSDILATTTYSLMDCFRSCAYYNANNANGCKAVAFTATLRDSITSHDGNCWLKNSTGNLNRNADANNQAVAVFTSVTQ